MNCKKCGQPLNGATVCPNCGTSIGYVVNDASSIPIGPADNNNNGYVQNNAQVDFGQNNGYVQNSIPTGFGPGISEPSDGAFNKNFGKDGLDKPVDVVDKMSDLFKDGGSKKKKAMKKVADNVEKVTNTPTLVDFGSTNYTEDNDEAVLARAGTMSKDMLIEQMNGTNAFENSSKKNSSDGWSMKLPDDKKTTKIWLIVGVIILLVIIVGVYILPLFTDVGYSQYENENFVIKYKKEWTSQVDPNTNKVNFLYKDTGYKIIVNGVSTFSEMKFVVNTPDDRRVLYNAFYDSWKNVSGGRLAGGTNTFIDLEEDNSMYAKIDYVLSGDQGVGSFYVVVCQKYDLVISFMTYCKEKDRVEFEENVMEFINGIDYVGVTAEEKEQQEYQSFKAEDIKQYKAGTLIDYGIPNAWTLDTSRTSAVNNQYNVFEFKDEMSLLEIKAYQGNYTYESMKASAISNFGALKSEEKMTINGKVWYVITTPDYDSGGYSYHNELYFTMSTNNKAIYFVQAYVFNETSNDSVKRTYFENSLKYILENMTLNNVND